MNEDACDMGCDSPPSMISELSMPGGWHTTLFLCLAHEMELDRSVRLLQHAGLPLALFTKVGR